MRDYTERILADQRNSDEWHTARANRIGGSDAANFAVEASIMKYAQAKLMPSWDGSLAASNGHEREAIVLPELGWEQNHFLIASEVNDRFAATPDGIDPVHKRLAQMKTSKHPLPGKIPPKFLRQIYWEQFVMGSDYRETDLIFEKYEIIGDKYVPDFTPQIITIPRDDEAILILVSMATRVLGYMDKMNEGF